MIQLLVKLVFASNNPLKIRVHQGQYLSTYNTYGVEISLQLKKCIFQTTL